jgi:hypothetical protein
MKSKTSTLLKKRKFNEDVKKEDNIVNLTDLSEKSVKERCNHLISNFSKSKTNNVI